MEEEGGREKEEGEGRRRRREGERGEGGGMGKVRCTVEAERNVKWLSQVGS